MACCKASKYPQLNPLFRLNASRILSQFFTTPVRMKTSIPSEVWENKRAEIAALYKEEEWPLKQVIKKIRSDDFNPTETQLRSRLKKWGVTKPSRQKRKKQNDGPTVCPTLKHPGRLELTTVNDPSATQAASFSDKVGWSDLKGWMVPSGYTKHHILKDSTILEAHRVAADWISSSTIPNDRQLGNHTNHSFHHLTTPSPLSSVHSYGHPNPVTSSTANSAINASISCQTGFAKSPISASDPSAKTLPGERPTQASSAASESNPMTPWSYVASDMTQSCPSHLFLIGDGGSDYADNGETISSEQCTHPSPGPTAMSPNSDADLLQLDPKIKAWRRAASAHVRPDGIGKSKSPRVDSVPFVRRQPQMKRRKELSFMRQHDSTIQPHSEKKALTATPTNTSLKVPETNSDCKSALPSVNDSNHEYTETKPTGES
ncbi:hypothetical protein GX48_03321 [Paracoccidioides brasiliensis]|nr:hypothetical protein GX48_03321 [Paracoccidioides brasiliensis]